MALNDSTDEHNNCIFCKIVQGAFPPLGDGLIREDDQYMARLSPFPNTPWFTVVIPKKHYGSDCLEMPDEQLASFIKAAKHVSSLLKKAMPDVWRVGLMMEWTWVDHAHIKLSPMHWTEWINEWKWEQNHSEVDTFFEKYEGYMMSHDWPRADDNELKELAEKIKNG